MKVRRPEFKRKRAYKRRAIKRHPLSRILRDCMRDMTRELYGKIFPLTTPLYSLAKAFTAENDEKVLRWGGTGMYFDVVVNSPYGVADYAGHSAKADSYGLSKRVVPVNYVNPVRGS